MEENKQTPNNFYDLQGARLLIADDDPMMRLIFRKILLSWNATVHLASCGMEALNCVQQNTFDAVLMDVEMPGMTGFESTSQIRKLGGAYARLPVLAMTSARFEDIRKQLTYSGMTGFMDKGCEPADLFDRLNGLIRQGR